MVDEMENECYNMIGMILDWWPFIVYAFKRGRESSKRVRFVRMILKMVNTMADP